MKKLEKGSSLVTLIIIIGVLLIIGSAVSFYLLAGSGQTPKPLISPGKFGDQNSVDSIGGDIDSANIDSPDTDLNDLDNSASTL